MNGELILTSYTYDDGRVALNTAFSATAYFNNVQADGTITGSTYYSGATPLETIIQNLAGGIQYAANGLAVTGDTVGLGGAITGNTTIDLQGGDLIFSANPAGDVYFDTIRVILGSSALGSDRLQVQGKILAIDNITTWSNIISSISNTYTGLVSGGGNIIAGSSNSATTAAQNIFLAAGTYNWLDNGQISFILGGSGHTIIDGKNLSIINGYDNMIPTGLENIVMIGTTGETASENNTVYMPNVHASSNITGTTLYSGGTDISLLLISAANLHFIKGTGLQSIKANNGTANFASSPYAFSIGAACNAAGFGAFAGGLNSIASSEEAFAFGANVSATSINSAVIGTNSIANASYAFATNIGNTAAGAASSACGSGTTATGQASQASGIYSQTTGNFSHAEGNSTIASGEQAHAEGYGAQAIGEGSHAEGFYTAAIGSYSHAEGYQTTASAPNSHAQGAQTTASGNYSHAGGYGGSGQVEAGGEGAFNHQVTLAGAANAAANYSAILGGNDNNIDIGATRAVILGMNGFSATTSDTTYMANTYVDGVFNLNPQEGVPTPTAVRGRVFFSGSPLNRLMVNTGGTANDWMVLN